MPVALYAHCQLAIGNGAALVTFGGIGPGGDLAVRTALRFDLEADRWTPLANLTHGRYAAGCGLVRDAAGEERKVVVAGGSGKTAFMDSVEVLDLANMMWTLGKSDMKSWEKG